MSKYSWLWVVLVAVPVCVTSTSVRGVISDCNRQYSRPVDDILQCKVDLSLNGNVHSDTSPDQNVPLNESHSYSFTCLTPSASTCAQINLFSDDQCKTMLRPEMRVCDSCLGLTKEWTSCDSERGTAMLETGCSESCDRNSCTKAFTLLSNKCSQFGSVYAMLTNIIPCTGVQVGVYDNTTACASTHTDNLVPSGGCNGFGVIVAGCPTSPNEPALPVPTTALPTAGPGENPRALESILHYQCTDTATCASGTCTRVPVHSPCINTGFNTSYSIKCDAGENFRGGNGTYCVELTGMDAQCSSPSLSMGFVCGDCIMQMPGHFISVACNGQNVTFGEYTDSSCTVHAAGSTDHTLVSMACQGNPLPTGLGFPQHLYVGRISQCSTFMNSTFSRPGCDHAFITSRMNIPQGSCALGTTTYCQSNSNPNMPRPSPPPSNTDRGATAAYCTCNDAECKDCLPGERASPGQCLQRNGMDSVLFSCHDADRDKAFPARQCVDVALLKSCALANRETVIGRESLVCGACIKHTASRRYRRVDCTENGVLLVNCGADASCHNCNSAALYDIPLPYSDCLYYSDVSKYAVPSKPYPCKKAVTMRWFGSKDCSGDPLFVSTTRNGACSSKSIASCDFPHSETREVVNNKDAPFYFFMFVAFMLTSIMLCVLMGYNHYNRMRRGRGADEYQAMQNIDPEAVGESVEVPVERDADGRRIIRHGTASPSGLTAPHWGPMESARPPPEPTLELSAAPFPEQPAKAVNDESLNPQVNLWGGAQPHGSAAQAHATGHGGVTVGQNVRWRRGRRDDDTHAHEGEERDALSLHTD